MRVILLLFFTFTLPVAIFLSIVLYGGITNQTIKVALQNSPVYEKTATMISDMSADDATGTDSEEVISVIKSRFTPSYIQTKAEEAIDTSYAWISGETKTPPSISFKEIKADIIAKNPDLLPSLLEMSKEMKNQPPEGEDQTQAQEMAKTMDSLVQSDFTFHLEKQLTGLKSFYGTLRILQPFLILLLLAYIGIMFLLCSSWLSRLKWLSAFLGIAGVWGFVIILLNNLILSSLTINAASISNEVAAIAAPIGLAIAKKFADAFMTYQGILSIALFFTAAILLIIVEVTKPKTTPIPTTKPNKKK